MHQFMYIDNDILIRYRVTKSVISRCKVYLISYSGLILKCNPLIIHAIKYLLGGNI